MMWKHTSGKKHNHLLISDILKGERPQITDNTPELYAKLMKMCWDHDPENRPTAEEIMSCLWGYVRSNATKEIKKSSN